MYIGSNAGSLGKKFFNEIIKLTTPEDVILEFGSGESTKQLKNNYRTVISIEHDPLWATEDSKLVSLNRDGSYNTQDLHKVFKGLEYTIIVIDAPPGYGHLQGSRSKLLNSDLDFGKARLVFVDDTNRPDELWMAEEIKKKYGFESYSIKDGIKEGTVLYKK